MRKLEPRSESARVEQLEARLRRLRYVRQLRALEEPREVSQEQARVEACRDAGSRRMARCNRRVLRPRRRARAEVIEDGIAWGCLAGVLLAIAYLIET